MRFSSVLLLLGLLPASEAAAQSEPLVEVRLSPQDTQDAARPHRWIFELAPTSGPVEVVADRRLLELTIRPEGRGRRVRCRHPDRVSRVRDGRVVTIGNAEQPVWREWIDLRMYCWGRRARLAIARGGTLEVRYGFRRGGRDRWVARAPGAEAARRRGRSLRAAPVTFEGTASTDAEEARDDEPLAVTLARSDVRSGAGLSFRTTLRPTGDPVRVYLRDDLFSFIVRGPLGEVRCLQPVQRINPIIDFYRRLRGRSRARASIAARRWCPEGTFELAGIYEVTPVVELIYDGARYGIEVLTGTFSGEPTPIRVRAGSRGYVEQVPGETPAPQRERVL